MAEFNWDDTSNLENSIFDTIVNNYTVKELCTNVKEKRDDYVGSIKSVNFCYESFEDEINEVMSIDEARKITYGSTDYDDIKSVQVSEAICRIMKDIYDDYEEVFALHPDKNVSDIVNEEFYYHWTGNVSDNNYKAYKTIEDFIKNEFLCNEILTAQKANSDIKELSYNQCALINAAFPSEIKSNAKIDKNNPRTTNPFKALEYIVNEHVDNVYHKIIKENKEALIKNPGIKIKDAIAKEKSNQNIEMEK